jgi:excisionase family DNA binding protein
MTIELPELQSISEKLDQILTILNEKKGNIDSDKSNQSDRLLNVKEVSAFIRVAQITVYKWTSAREIPFIKIGGRVLFKHEDVEKWIDKRKVKSLRP